MIGMPRYFNMLFSQTASHVAMVAPLYSAFVLDNANVGCFLLLHEVALLPREKKNPEVDRLSTLWLAQSASVYPSNRTIVSNSLVPTDVHEYSFSAI